MSDDPVQALKASGSVAEAGILREAEQWLGIWDRASLASSVTFYCRLGLVRDLVAEVQRLRAEQEQREARIADLKHENIMLADQVGPLAIRANAAESRLTALVEGLRLIEQHIRSVSAEHVVGIGQQQQWAERIMVLRIAASQP